MIDLGPNIAVTGNCQMFAESLKEARALTPQMGDVQATMTASRARKPGQFLSRGIARRGIDERRPHTHRTFAHRLVNKPLHAQLFIRGRGPVHVPKHVYPYGRRTNERCNIRGNPLRLEMSEVLAKRPPTYLIPDLFLTRRHLRRHAISQRAHRPTFAKDLQCHTLHQVRDRTAVVYERLGRP